tara:strand:- start:10 stop:324 length:315 start_codon:yes stop_codon:yes gene_type:complete
MIALALIWSKAKSSSSDRADVHVLTYGNWRIRVKSGLLKPGYDEISRESPAKGLQQMSGGIGAQIAPFKPAAPHSASITVLGTPSAPENTARIRVTVSPVFLPL